MSHDAKSPRILIAEDDEIQGAILRSALQGRGYEADLVTDGLEAVRRLRTGQYDLALLDYHMPAVDGLAAARLLHEFLSDEDRPRLIAVTAAAEGLSQKERGSVTAFDAVVSKGLGLPALLNVVDSNLTRAAAVNGAAVIARGRLVLREQARRRRRRLLAPIAALPAICMMVLFAVGLAWSAASLQHVDATAGSAMRADALSSQTAALVGAVQDTEASQRTYLATRADSARLAFETDAQHVDQLLVSAAPETASGAPGFGDAPAAQEIIEPRLRTLAMEARSWPVEATSETPKIPLSGARETADWLRGWAMGLVSRSQQAVLAGLAAIRVDMEVVLGVLAAGVLFAVFEAAHAIRRRLREPLSASAAVAAATWQRQTPPPLRSASRPELIA